MRTCFHTSIKVKERGREKGGEGEEGERERERGGEGRGERGRILSSDYVQSVPRDNSVSTAAG